MDFELCDEQRMMKDSLRRTLTDPDLEVVSLWQICAELGLTMAGIDEAQGGIGGGAIELAIIAEEIGRQVLPLSWAGFSASLGVLKALDEPGFAGLGRLAEGTRYALAWSEAAQASPHALPETTAERKADGGFILNGKKIVVVDGQDAEIILCTAQLEGQYAVFELDASMTEAGRSSYSAVGGAAVADLKLDRVQLPADALLASGARAQDAVVAGFDLGTLMACAEAVGSLQRSFELTSTYLAERKQFGRALSDFQVLQHRVVDLLVAAEEARALLHFGLSAQDAPAKERGKAVSSCKLRLSKVALDCIGDAVHMHGGMGITSEYPIGHHFMKALAFQHLWGTSDFHLDRIV